MSTELEKALLSFASTRKKIEVEVRVRYNTETGEIIDHSSINKEEKWEDPYIVIDKNYIVHPKLDYVKDGKIKRRKNEGIAIYWQSTPAETLNNNPWFCKRQLEWKQ